MNIVFKRVPDKQLAGVESLNRRNLQHLQRITHCGKHSRSARQSRVTEQIQLPRTRLAGAEQPPPSTPTPRFVPHIWVS